MSICKCCIGSRAFLAARRKPKKNIISCEKRHDLDSLGSYKSRDDPELPKCKFTVVLVHLLWLNDSRDMISTQIGTKNPGEVAKKAMMLADI